MFSHSIYEIDFRSQDSQGAVISDLLLLLRKAHLFTYFNFDVTQVVRKQVGMLLQALQ